MTGDQSSMFPRLEVQARADSHATRVVVVGEVDMATAPQLDQAFAKVVEQQPARVVVDLADMDFVDCVGGRVIADAVSVLATAGAEVTVRSPNRTARVVLDAAGVDWVGQPTVTGRPAPRTSHRGQ